MPGKKVYRRDVLKTVWIYFFCLCITGVFQGCGSIREKEASLPNFIVIFTDDQGYGDLGVSGATDIATPNIDRMAREGIQFTNFYVGGAVCTPSRASLMTGCYPKRIGLQTGVLFPNDKTGLNTDEITVAELLREKGYATFCIGKWHLGRPPELMPTSQGFDYYFGIPYSNDMLPEHVLSESMGGFPELPLVKNDEVIEAPVDQTTLTERYTEEAVRLIEENRNKPFFIYLAHSMPHYPNHSSEQFTGSSRRGSYGDSVQEIDAGVGRIVQTLKEQGIDRNTLMIFTSDNGPWREAQEIDYMGLGGDGSTGSALPLSGWKGETLEGGMRVPTVMRWPGRLPPDTRCHALASTLDILPTIVKLAGAEIPGDRVIDGKDISGLLEDPASGSPHDYFFYFSIKTGKLNAIRDAGGYKLHFWRDPRGYVDNTPFEVKELYYLPDDIDENENLYTAKPEVVKRLKAAAAQFEVDVVENARPVGRVP